MQRQKKGDWAISYAIKQQRINVFNLLLKNGFDIEKTWPGKGNKIHTILHDLAEVDDGDVLNKMFACLDANKLNRVCAKLNKEQREELRRKIEGNKACHTLLSIILTRDDNKEQLASKDSISLADQVNNDPRDSTATILKKLRHKPEVPNCSISDTKDLTKNSIASLSQPSYKRPRDSEPAKQKLKFQKVQPNDEVVDDSRDTKDELSDNEDDTKSPGFGQSI